MFSEIFFPLDIPKIRKSLPITMKLIKPEIQKSRNRFLWYFTIYFFFFRENENLLPHLVPGYFFLCIDQALPQSKWAMVHTKKSQLTSQPHCQRPCKDEISNYIHLLYFLHSKWFRYHDRCIFTALTYISVQLWSTQLP